MRSQGEQAQPPLGDSLSLPSPHYVLGVPNPSVRDSFPTPIAERYAATADGSLGAAVNTFQATLDVLVAAVVGAHLDREMPSDVRRAVWDVLRGEKWSDGQLVGLLRRASGSLSEDEPGGLGWPRENRERALKWCDCLVAGRNDDYGHSTNLGAAATEAKAVDYLADVERLLSEAPWLRDREVWVPRQTDNQRGLVVRADVYRGVEPQRDEDVRNVGVKLARDQRDVSGGPVQDGVTPLLVDRAERSAVSLAPFATCHEDALWFLKGVSFGREGDVTGATYKAYGRDDTFEAPRQSYEALRVGALVATVRPRANAHGLGLSGVWTEQSEHLRGFVGRSGPRRDLAEWATDPAQRGYRVVLGPPGQGKSALLARLAADLGAVDPVESVLQGGSGGEAGQSPAVVLHHVKESGDPVTILRSLLEQARALAGLGTPRREPEGVVALRNALAEALAEVPGGAVLVVDALDELDGLDLAFLPPRLPSGVRGVLSCRPDVPLLDALRVHVAPRTEHALGPLERSDLDALLTARVEADVAADVADAVDMGAVYDRTRGTALLVREAVRVLDEAHKQGALADVESQIPATLDAVFRRQVREAVAGLPLAERVLGLLAVARDALTTRAVHGALDALGERASFGDVRRAVEALSEVLVSGPGGHRLYHEGLAEHVRAEVLGPDLGAVHDALSEWSRLGGPSAAYGRLHRAVHLAEAVRCAEAERTDPTRRHRALRAELTSWEALADAARHGALHARGQAYLAAAPTLEAEERNEAEAWGELARAEAARCRGADDLLQQALLLPENHPVRRAGAGAEADRPLLVPVEQPDVTAPPGRLVLGAGAAVTRLAPFAGGFVAFRGRDAWAFDWEGRSTTVRPEVLAEMIDGIDVAVPLDDGHYEVRQRPAVTAAVARDPGPEQADGLGPSKPVAAFDDDTIVVASYDAIRVHDLSSGAVKAQIAVDDLFGRSREEVGLANLQTRPRLNVLPAELWPAPSVSTLAGGAHAVIWAMNRASDTVHYVVWNWKTHAVTCMFDVEWGTPTPPEDEWFGIPSDGERKAWSPIAIGGDKPLFILVNRLLVRGASCKTSQVPLVEAASPDGRYLYGHWGLVWDTESGALVADIGHAEFLGFSADGRRVLWDLHEVQRQDAEDPGSPTEKTSHTLMVSSLDGRVGRSDGAIRSDLGFRAFASTVGADAALGESAAAVAYPDGSVRVVPLRGAHEQSLSGPRDWDIRSVGRGILTWSAGGLSGYPGWKWMTLGDRDSGTDAFRETYYGETTSVAEALSTRMGKPSGSYPEGELLGWGGHTVIDGDPHAYAAYALRAEPGIAEVRLENLRDWTSKTIGRYPFAEHDPMMVELVATPKQSRSTDLQAHQAWLEFIPLDGGRVVVVAWEDARRLMNLSDDPGGGVVYLPTSEPDAVRHRLSALHGVVPVPGGDYVIVDGEEEVDETHEGTLPLPRPPGRPALFALDTTLGVAANAFDAVGMSSWFRRLLCVDENRAVLSLGGRLAVWDYVEDEIVAQASLPEGYHVWFGAPPEPGDVIIACTEPSETMCRFGRWSWGTPQPIEWLGGEDFRLDSYSQNIEFGGVSASLAVITNGNRLLALDLSSGEVASVCFEGDVSAAVFEDEVIATDRRGLWRLASDSSQCRS